MPITELQIIPADDDHHALSLNLTGGIKAWKLDDDEWSLGPIKYSGHPAIVGSLSTAELHSAISQLKISPIQFENTTVVNGITTTFLQIAVRDKLDRSFGAADAWHFISRNAARKRLLAHKHERSNSLVSEPNVEQTYITSEEKFADYISDSLRSMDICISSICNYYHQSLISSFRDGREPRLGFSHTSDLPFIANVHSFFVHVGAARDYLASLIASRLKLPARVDAMSRLVKALTWEKLPPDPLIRHLVSEGCLAAEKGSTKCKVSGWLEDVSNLRNSLIHTRPYGSHEAEKFGRIESVEGLDGHYIYVKPIDLDDGEPRDALDVVAEIYVKIGHLFHELACSSGGDTSIPTLTDSDIIELKARE